MEIFDHLLLGFQVAGTLTNLMYCLIGVVIGTAVGVLPGIGPVPAIALLLPLTFVLPPISALIMLAGIYYGAQYGGSTTAILIRMPGETSSVITCLDGHEMARQGRAGPALAIAALGSLFAGCVGTLLIALFAPPLTDWAVKFGPGDYFALMVLGLVAAVVLARGSLVKALAMVVLGLLIGTIGVDLNSGQERFTFGIPELRDGIGFVVLAMGCFGLSDVITNLEKRGEAVGKPVKVGRLWPSRDDFRASWKAALRGTGLGALLGVLPGGGVTLASFSAYALEIRLAKDPTRFGKGAVEGVAAPEAANNAAAQTSFIPLLTLGIPSNAVMALMLGAMMIQGITPGPQVIDEQPTLFWGLIASMWIGNVMLVVLNLPLVGMWVRLLRTPYRLLFPAILAFCCIGAYSLSNNVFDIQLMALFGLIGYIFLKLECEPAPLLLGFVLGPLMEENLRRGILLAHGEYSEFFFRPIALTLFVLAALLLVLAVLPKVRRKRDVVFVEED